MRLRAALSAHRFGIVSLFLLPAFVGSPVNWIDRNVALSGAVAAEVDSGVTQARYRAQFGLDRWHAAGQVGRGVKVAVLDSGFRGYRNFLGKGLPDQVAVRSFRSDGNLEARDSQHGILCGEVIHTLAPEAEMLFANWEPDSPEQFLEAVRWAKAQGAQVISCSVISPSWSDGEGGGPVHRQLQEILGDGSKAKDLLFVSCAGNTARRHWGDSFAPGKDGWHRWASGLPTNEVTPWRNDEVSVDLYWPAGSRYELQVIDSTSGAAVKPFRTTESSMVVRIQPAAGHKYQARVRLSEGNAGRFHLVALGGDLQYAEAAGSVCFPADGRAVVAVGAVDERGRRMAYSSCGLNSQLPKPDLVAPVPFPSRCRATAFGGTSAAAPQAAGIAALCWARHPDWSAAKVRTTLQAAALDLGPVGYDTETGYGQLKLPKE